MESEYRSRATCRLYNTILFRLEVEVKIRNKAKFMSDVFHNYGILSTYQL